MDGGGDGDGGRNGHGHNEHNNNSNGKRGAHAGKPQLKKAPSGHAPANLLSPIKQDLSSGFGRLAK